MSSNPACETWPPQDELQLRIERDETIVFASSSGHCNLDCSYCIISPIAKHQLSLSYDDLRFVLDQLTGRVFMIFSGTGDFFAAQRRDDRLLTRLLEDPRLSVALDINGVVVHCIDTLPAEALARIRQVNLTVHYQQLVDHNALRHWQRNALMLLQRLEPVVCVNMILSPPEQAVWEPALEWYEANVHRESPKPLHLIQDVNRPLTAADDNVIAHLQQRFGSMIRSVRRGSFAQVFEPFDYVTCPAGQEYFRIWHDGRIQACPNVPALHDCGHAKERRFAPRTAPIDCHDARHCDCYHIASAGKMVFHRAGQTPARR